MKSPIHLYGFSIFLRIQLKRFAIDSSSSNRYFVYRIFFTGFSSDCFHAVLWVDKSAAICSRTLFSERCCLLWVMVCRVIPQTNGFSASSRPLGILTQRSFPLRCHHGLSVGLLTIIPNGTLYILLVLKTLLHCFRNDLFFLCLMRTLVSDWGKVF